MTATRFGADEDSRRLGGLVRLFSRHTSPRLIAASLVLVAVVRVALGSWGTADLIVAATLVAAQPFSEWVIHVVMLHFRPRTVRGRRIDLHVAAEHRRHHRDPGDVPLIFIPLRTLVASLIAGTVIFGIVFRSRLSLTAAMTALVLMLVYEWTHFLIHSPYQPRTSLYRAIRRGHRLHHFKNEHYWFGVTHHLGDRVLRTYPAKSAVETSPTCRTLDVTVD